MKISRFWKSFQNSKLNIQHSKFNDRGVTIIEALMVLGVIGFIMSLIAVMAFTGMTAWQKQSVRLKLENQAQNFMYVLSDKLRQAQPGSVLITNYSGEMSNSMITFTQVNQSHPVSIYLQTVNGTGGAKDRKVWMFEPVSNGAPTPTYSYSAQGQILATNVVSLYFTYPKIADNTRIQVSISLEQYPFKNKPPVNYQATEIIYVRN